METNDQGGLTDTEAKRFLWQLDFLYHSGDVTWHCVDITRCAAGQLISLVVYSSNIKPSHGFHYQRERFC